MKMVHYVGAPAAPQPPRYKIVVEVSQQTLTDDDKDNAIRRAHNLAKTFGSGVTVWDTQEDEES